MYFGEDQDLFRVMLDLQQLNTIHSYWYFQLL